MSVAGTRRLVPAPAGESMAERQNNEEPLTEAQRDRRRFLERTAIAAGVAMTAGALPAAAQVTTVAAVNEDSLPMELRSATAALAVLRAREIGSLEMLDLLLARIERLNPRLNAVIALDVDGARSAARAADNLPARRRGALHGLPMTIKDGFDVVGMPATAGMPELADYRPAEDAEAVAQLRAAGAILFGKTNVPTGVADHQSYNPIYGVSSNPWNVERTPGGSSGGAAAAVAAGFTALELGSDVGGSIRCPAHFCGVYGHKPSFGVIPMGGTTPPPPPGVVPPDVPLSVAGPLARSAADLELALDVLTAPPLLERTAWSVGIPPSRHERLSDFRVALWADKRGYSVDSQCLEAMHAYAEDLRALGVTVDETARPDIDSAASDDVYVAMLFGIFLAGLPEEVLRQFEAAAEGHGERSYPARIARAIRLTHAEFMGLESRQQGLRHAWRRFFERYDVMLCPAMPTVAFPHDHSGTGFGHIAQYDRRLIVDGEPVPYLNGLQWPGLATIAHLPAAAVPTGRLIDGLPMGVQVIGPYLEDRTVLRFAQLVERELGGFAPPPDVI